MKLKIILAVVIVLALLAIGYYYHNPQKKGFLGFGQDSSTTISKDLPPPPATPQTATPAVFWSTGHASINGVPVEGVSNMTIVVRGQSVSLGDVAGLCSPFTKFNKPVLPAIETDGILCFSKDSKEGVAFGLFHQGSIYEVRKAKVVKTSDTTVIYGDFKTIKTLK